MKIAVAITGASGSIYGVSLMKALIHCGHQVHGIISPMGEQVLYHECALQKEEIDEAIIWHKDDDLFAPLASGSYKIDAMVIAPCSMSSLAKISAGLGDSLISRAASVALKEGRKLILVPREMPLSIIHMEQMLTCAKAGAVILPASPGFYHDPQSMGDLIGHVVGKILDLLHIENDLFTHWKNDERR